MKIDFIAKLNKANKLLRERNCIPHASLVALLSKCFVFCVAFEELSYFLFYTHKNEY